MQFFLHLHISRLTNHFRPGRSDSPVKRVTRLNHDGRLHRFSLILKMFHWYCKTILLNRFLSNRRLPRSRSVPKGTFTFSNSPSPSSSETTKRGLNPIKNQLILWHNLCSSYEQDCPGEEYSPKPEEHQVKSWLHDELQLQGWSSVDSHQKKCTNAQIRKKSLFSLAGDRWRLWAIRFGKQSWGQSLKAARWESIQSESIHRPSKSKSWSKFLDMILCPYFKSWSISCPFTAPCSE